MITGPRRRDDSLPIAFFDDAEREPGLKLLWDLEWRVVKISVQEGCVKWRSKQKIGNRRSRITVNKRNKCYSSQGYLTFVGRFVK